MSTMTNTAPETTETAISPVQEKFQDFRDSTRTQMLERSSEVQVVLAAMLSNEHVCLVGEPGTGKSMVLDAIVQWMAAPSYKMLLNKYTTPEELIGPIAISKMKLDVYQRILTGRAADAEILFLDEIFKGSPSILNTLLMLLNERKVHDGSAVVDTPLRLCVSASNEWPGEGQTGNELSALFDRFLFRKQVRPLRGEANIEALCFGGVGNFSPTDLLTPAELAEAQRDVAAMQWTDAGKDAFHLIRRQVRSQGILVGDRRLKKSVLACQANAYLNGSPAVRSEDLDILEHILWVDPAEQPAEVQKIVLSVAAPALIEVNARLAEAEEIEAGVNINDFKSCVAGITKLNEVARKLKNLQGDKAAEAHSYVSEMMAKMKANTLQNT